jgi:hypothetical protein
MLLTVSLLLILALTSALSFNFAGAEKFNFTNDCPFLPSSETAQPLPQMKCHDPLCLSYFGNYSLSTKNEEMEQRCWLPAENRSLGSLFP